MTARARTIAKRDRIIAERDLHRRKVAHWAALLSEASTEDWHICLAEIESHRVAYDAADRELKRLNALIWTSDRDGWFD